MTAVRSAHSGWVRREAIIRKWPALASMALLLLASALGRWPPLFALILQLVVSVSAVYVLVNASRVGLTRWAWAMTIVALVFNPIVPARFPAELGRLAAVGAAGVFALWLTFVQGWPSVRDVVRGGLMRRRR